MPLLQHGLAAAVKLFQQAVGAHAPVFGDALRCTPVISGKSGSRIIRVQPIERGEQGSQLEGLDVHPPVDTLEPVIQVGVPVGCTTLSQPVTVLLALRPALHLQSQCTWRVQAKLARLRLRQPVMQTSQIINQRLRDSPTS
ncbi:MAG: hypothetical protein J0M33_28400 [Anaerolineae bacterium]|nr:hypothetical protein [Anaerolineae bacterium]